MEWYNALLIIDIDGFCSRKKIKMKTTDFRIKDIWLYEKCSTCENRYLYLNDDIDDTYGVYCMRRIVNEKYEGKVEEG